MISRWPRISRNAWRLPPRITNHDANEWRRSWKLKIEDYKRTLPPVLQNDTADESIGLLDQLHKSDGVNDATRDVYRRTILDWKRQENSLGTGTTSGAAKPAGAAKPLREPGTKAESEQ